MSYNLSDNRRITLIRKRMSSRLLLPFIAVIMMSACDGSGSGNSDVGTENNPQQGGGVTDDTDDVVDDGTPSEMGDFSGRWYGVLSPHGGVNESNVDESVVYEIDLEEQSNGVYPGMGRVLTGFDADGADSATFSVRAVVEGENLRIEQTDALDVGTMTRSNDSDDGLLGCQRVLTVSLAEEGLEGTWASTSGECDGGVVTLRRPRETRSSWYDELPDCPCTLTDELPGSTTTGFLGTWSDVITPGGAGRLIPFFELDLADHHPGASFAVRWSPDEEAGSGQQCTYDAERRLITGGLAAGTPDLVAPGTAEETLAHFYSDVEPFYDQDSGPQTSCRSYLQQWPPNNGFSCPSLTITPIAGEDDWTCERVRNFWRDGESFIPPVDDASPSDETPPVDEPSRAIEPQPVSYTDPHLVTLDGLGYSFQAVGEFVLVRSELEGLEIQARQAQYGNSGVQASINVGFAFRVDGTEVAIVDSPDGELTAYIDGQPQPVGENVALPGGGTLAFGARRFSIAWADGSIAHVDDRGRFLNLSLGLSIRHASQVVGLLGNYDGDPENDLKTSGGDDIGPRPEANELYGAFADGWRVADETSLFQYFSGESTETFTDRLFPNDAVSVDDLSDDDRRVAEVVCRERGVVSELLLNNCILDVALTGDAAFADAISEVQEDIPSNVQTAEVMGEIDRPTLDCAASQGLIDDIAESNGADRDDISEILAPPLAPRYVGTLTDQLDGSVWSLEVNLTQCELLVTGTIFAASGEENWSGRFEAFRYTSFFGSIEEFTMTDGSGCLSTLGFLLAGEIPNVEGSLEGFLFEEESACDGLLSPQGGVVALTTG